MMNTSKMYKLEFVLPHEFYLDNTLSRFPYISCPKCSINNNDIIKSGSHVVGTSYHDEVEQRMVMYYGCKTCHFRWIPGRKLTFKEDFNKWFSDLNYQK